MPNMTDTAALVSRTSDGRVYWATAGRALPKEQRGLWLPLTHPYARALAAALGLEPPDADQ